MSNFHCCGIRHSFGSFGLVVVIALVAVVASPSHAERREQRPNIVLIMSDDVGRECFGCYGSRQYKTPSIDQLARQGMRFEHCYSQPLCTPSRIKIMTGKSNVRNYSAFSILNSDQRTIGHYLQAAGYKTMVAGKWQLLGAEHYSKQFRGKGTSPEKAGFDSHCLWQVDRLGSRYRKPLLHINGTNRQFAKNVYGPDVVVDHITQFMDKHAKAKRPFFVYYPMILSHSPFQPTPDSKSRSSKNAQKNYEDMVAYMDKLVGRIVTEIQRLGIEKETIVIFTSDNGTHRKLSSTLNGRTIRGGKGLTTDAGCREPLVVKWPGRISSGAVSDALVDFSDFLPTLLSLAGQSTVPKRDGISFHGQLLGKKAPRREWVYCYYCPRPERSTPVRFVRDRRWKLYGDGRLYDVSSDELEKKDLSKSEQADATAARLRLGKAMQAMPAKGQSLLKFPSQAP